jgi:hypothetical protein
MRKEPSWPDDPVVREVRAARAELWKEAGGTIEGLMRLAKKRAAEIRRSRRVRRGRR